MALALTIGDEVPDFELSNQYGQKVRLSDYRGKKTVVLVFYPFAFSGICTGELCLLRDEISDFVTEGVETLAISCDPVPTLKAWSDQESFGFQLLSDFWPHGEVAQAYDVFWPTTGFATRGTFIVDTEGVLRWSVVNGPGEARSLADYRQALAQLA